jgi:hypothetical protein
MICDFNRWIQKRRDPNYFKIRHPNKFEIKSSKSNSKMTALPASSTTTLGTTTGRPQILGRSYIRTTHSIRPSSISSPARIFRDTNGIGVAGDAR